MSNKKIDVPEYMKNCKELKGVSVGACVLTNKWSKGRRVRDKGNNFIKDNNGKYVREPMACAHAHTRGPGKGFICFRSMEDFNNEKTRKHELAHIITGEGHTIKWAEKYVELVSDTPKTAKWLTVEWLRKKYGFDDEGREGENLFKEWLKVSGLNESDIKNE